MILLKVKKLITVQSFGWLPPGTEIGLPETMAEHMIRGGYAERIQHTPPVIEMKSVEPPEPELSKHKKMPADPAKEN